MKAQYWGHVEERICEYEDAVLSEARLDAYGNFGGRELSDLELLALLQHNGAATRLLDFTQSLLIALWFACVESPDTTGHIIGISPTTELLAADVMSRAPLGALIDRDPHGILTFQSTPIHPRIRAQHSVFAFSKTTDQVWGSFPFPLGSKHIFSFAVTPRVKQEMVAWGSRLFGFSDKAMFPDLGGFGKYHAAGRVIPLPVRRAMDRRRRVSEGEIFNSFRPALLVPEDVRRATAPELEQAAEVASPGDASERAIDGSEQILTGDTAALYWYFLNRAAGFPVLGVFASTGRAPGLEHFPNGIHGGRLRASFEVIDGSGRTAISVREEDDTTAAEGVEKGRIAEEDREFLRKARACARPTERRQLRRLSEAEEEILEDSVRARVYWLGVAARDRSSRDTGDS